ncbi:hypothetical protein BGZ68_003674, partial [Mortierella alpina]
MFHFLKVELADQKQEQQKASVDKDNRLQGSVGPESPEASYHSPDTFGAAPEVEAAQAWDQSFIPTTPSLTL